MSGFNSIYLLLIIPAILGWLAQYRVRQIYFRYQKISNQKGVTGIEIAKTLLSGYDLNVPILRTKRAMLNYYNPQDKSLYLSEAITQQDSVTAMGIVAHEVGHVLQDHQGSKYMRLRNKMAKSLAVMGQFSPLVFMWGVLFGNLFFIYLGVILLFGMAVFALISLPVELDASNRAVKMLKENNLAGPEEIKMAGVVLRHAALTYFAGAAQRIGTFLFILMLLFMSHRM